MSDERGMICYSSNLGVIDRRREGGREGRRDVP